MSGGTGSSTQLVTPTSHFLTVHKTAVEYSVIIVLNRNIGQLSTDLGVRGQRSSCGVQDSICQYAMVN